MFALLDTTATPTACTAFCLALSDAIGPTVANVVLMVMTGAAVLYTQRRNAQKVKQLVSVVQQKADAAEQKASLATEEAAHAKRELEVLHASLRPPILPTGTGMSGQYEAVRIEGLPTPTPRSNIERNTP